MNDLRMLALAALELEPMQARLGGPALNLAQHFARREFDVLTAAYAASLSRGDLNARALHAVRLTDLLGLGAALGFATNDPERQTALRTLLDTFDAIAAARGGGAAGQKVAAASLETAAALVSADHASVLRRKADFFGEIDPVPDFASDLNVAFYNHSFLQRLSSAVRSAQSSNLVTTAEFGRYRALVAHWVRARHDAAATRFHSSTQVGRDLAGAERVLRDLVDGMALLEDFAPEDTGLQGELRSRWIALQGLWLAAAEAAKAHQPLSGYTRNLAHVTTRYGDGLPALLAADVLRSGSQALAALSRVIDTLAAQITLLPADSLNFELPGGLQLPRLSGQVAFNR